MSIVTIQLGQCGNQIGGELFSSIIRDCDTAVAGLSKSYNETYCNASVDRFFEKVESKGASSAPTLQARAVMVDMEAKVITQTMHDARKSGKWTYPPKQQFCQKRGSGNNWAHGYQVHGPCSKDAVVAMVTREVEKCDYFGGFLTMQSLAGGTGSGVGAYINECLRDEFPNSFIVNQVVWPYSAGEVSVQNYNAILTLSHLYQTSDGIILTENDVLHHMCVRRLGLSNISLNDMNGIIAHHLALLFQPACENGSISVRNPLGGMLGHVGAHPDYKLLTLRSIPLMSANTKQFSTSTWPGLLKHLRQMLISDTMFEEGIDWSVKASKSQRSFSHSLANLLVLRGQDLSAADTSQFTEPYLYPSWMPHGYGLLSWQQRRPINDYDKCALLLSNCQSPVASLDRTISKAWQMFAARAYVHQYLKHGLIEEDFIDSFACLEQVLANYKKL